jgi:hypothetical protein
MKRRRDRSDSGMEGCVLNQRIAHRANPLSSKGPWVGTRESPKARPLRISRTVPAFERHFRVLG